MLVCGVLLTSSTQAAEPHSKQRPYFAEPPSTDGLTDPVEERRKRDWEAVEDARDANRCAYEQPSPGLRLQRALGISPSCMEAAKARRKSAE